MTYYLSLGSNLGDKEQNLRLAVDEIRKQIGHIDALSAFHATEPWGFTSSNSFLNACCRVTSPLQPLQVLDATQAIEQQLGRTLKSSDGCYHDRPIDIDLLRCFDPHGQEVCLSHPRLRLPHPLMWQRDFVLLPLAEIAPEATRKPL